MIFNTLSMDVTKVGRKSEFVDIKLRIPRHVLEQMVQDVVSTS